MAGSLEGLGINFRDQSEESARIIELKKRTNRCVCRFCGGALSLRKITYAAYNEAKIDIFCDHCDRIELGVEPEIYAVAAYYIDELRYDHYPDLDDSAYKRRMNIAAVCNILEWGLKNMNLVDKSGFTVPLNFNKEQLGEVTIISDRSLREMGEQ